MRVHVANTHTVFLHDAIKRFSLFSAIIGENRSFSGPRISGRRKLIHDKIADGIKSIGDGTSAVTDVAKHSRTNRWGPSNHRTTNSTSPTSTNKFVSIAPIWFYALIGQFMEHRDQSRLWGGEIGATLLANFIVTISNIVDCSGRYDNSTQLLAKDLIQLTWTFRDADVAEVRASVLYSVGTAFDRLRDDAVINVLFGTTSGDSNMIRSIQAMSSNDPDDNCRALSMFLSQKIVQTVRAMHNPIQLLK